MKRLWFKSYLKAIENSVDSNLFRNFYIEEDGKERDVFNNGEHSCAYHTSSILFLFGHQEKVHATVVSTVKDLKQQQWQEITATSESDLEPGDVILWEDMEFPEEPGVLHKHLGFYIGDGQAITNSYKIGTPQKIKLSLNERRVEAIYRGKAKFEQLPQPEVETKST